MAPITVAIAGGSGHVGKPITLAFLSKQFYPSQVGRVVLLTRDASSPAVQELKSQGAEVVEGPISASALKGVDVLVNALGGRPTLDERNAYAKAASEAGVKVYIPSEFGVDHRAAGFQHAVFAVKEEHEDYSRKLGGLKVVSLITGIFQDDFFNFGKYLGFDTESRVYTAVGSASTKVTLTSLNDIALSTVRTSILAAENPNSFPDEIRTQSNSLSVEEFSAIITKLSGDKVEVKTINYEEYKASLPKDGNFPGYLRLVIGNGSSDFTKTNSNELLNPGQSLWKWETFEEYATKTKGSLWK